jgi:general nucleoside transport system ATP-binding protein
LKVFPAFQMLESLPLVELRGITKSFHGVVANHAVDFDVLPGEIHALLGENGAGKSTLMNILSGIYQADQGVIEVDGKQAFFASPRDALAAGIGMVHQHFRLVRAFTVAENVHLGWSETAHFIEKRRLEKHTGDLARQFGLEVSPAALISDLSAGEQQRVEILKVLVRGARLVILDEPTAVLTPSEVERLIVELRQFREAGKAIVIISHKLEEVLRIADRITVLRGGVVTAQGRATDFSVSSLAQALVGRETSMPHRPARQVRSAARLELHNTRLSDHYGAPIGPPFNLTVYGGEILGIAGVAGNGQRELSELLAGLTTPLGEISLDGRQVPNPHPYAFAKAGIAHIPEDRLKSAVAPTLAISPNMAIREYDRPPIRFGSWLNPKQMRVLAQQVFSSAKVKAAHPSTPFRNLSGGNQQRLVVAREARIASRVLIATYPTRGLDIGAVRDLQELLIELRERGVGVVLISEELDELLSLADRIAVLFKGRLSPVFKREDLDQETIGRLLGGAEVAEKLVI